jgi:hypothetical protein
LEPFNEKHVVYFGISHNGEIMQSIHTGSSTGEHTAQKLNLLISAEMAAVGMYTEALKSINNCSCIHDLATAMHCHQGRADLLAGEVRRLGVRPYQASSAWRAFAYVVDGGKMPLNEQTTVSTLADAEAKVTAQYEKWMLDTDFGVQHLARSLHPRQLATQATVSGLLVSTSALAA